jgi:hypothetical protein
MSNDQFDPNCRPGANGGVNANMARFAEMIEMILAKYAGGFATPVPVKMLDAKGNEVEMLISPIQALSNLCVSINDLEAQLAEMRMEEEDPEEDEEEDERPFRRRKPRRR